MVRGTIQLCGLADETGLICSRTCVHFLMVREKVVFLQKEKAPIMRKKSTTNLDAIKAMRRGSREAEMELLGPGFHSHNRVH